MSAMTPFRFTSLVAGMVAAAAIVSAAAAGTPPWVVVAKSHKWPTTSCTPGIFIKIPVGVVNGKRRPDALAVRLLVRQNGKFRRGSYGYDIRCGSWHRYQRPIEVMTPAIRELPFRTWRASRCTISLFGTSARSSDDIRLQLLCRARPQTACVPIE